MLSFIKHLFAKRGCGHAVGRITHRRPTRWLDETTPDPDSYVELSVEEVHNLLTNAGRDHMIAQAYDAPTKALEYIALSNDALTETATSTALSNEITANGLGRAAATFAHTDGTNSTTLTKVFTCTTAPQSAQKSCVCRSISPDSVICHVLAFTQRNLLVGDQLTVQYTITIG